MTTAAIVAELERQIGRLQQVRSLLGETDKDVATVPGGKRGRPKGSGKVAAKSAPGSVSAAVKPSIPKRTMSPEARERIAAAQRTRWAKQKGTGAQGKAISRKAGKKASAAPKATSPAEATA